MELMTLTSSFQPDKLIENFESAIWTERYAQAGDFEITSNDIETMVNLLPRETYITIRESTVPMIVENHKIIKSPRAIPKISITGRSFESVLERRGSVNQLSNAAVRTAWMMAASKESDAAYRAMRAVLGDAAQFQYPVQILPAVNTSDLVSPNDVIPEITLTMPADYRSPVWMSNVTYGGGHIVGYDQGGGIIQLYQSTGLAGNINKPPYTSPTFWTNLGYGAQYPNSLGNSTIVEISPGNLYETVLNLIAANHHGIKSVRPLPAGTKVAIEIYNGADLTNTYVIDARFDQIDSATYLLSEQGSTNVAYVYGNNGAASVRKIAPPFWLATTTYVSGDLVSSTPNVYQATALAGNLNKPPTSSPTYWTVVPEVSGLNRRVLIFDQSSDSTSALNDSLRSRGLIELYKFNATALVDGEISAQVAEDYNSKYYLGDIVKLVAEYGLTRNVRVAEFIRTSDATGEKAYPAFEAVDS
jgi:hypothetical protein